MSQTIAPVDLTQQQIVHQAAVSPLFLSPFQFLFKLSPDGEHLAYAYSEGEQSRLIVDRLDADLQRHRAWDVALQPDEAIQNIEWKTESALLIIAINRLTLRKKLYALRMADSAVDLSAGVEGCELAALLPAAAEHILVYDEKAGTKTLCAINIVSRERVELRRCADDEVKFFFDWSGQLRMIWRITPQGYQVLMPDAATQQFNPVTLLPFDGVFIPIFTSVELQADFYAITNIDREFTSLARVSFCPALTLIYFETGIEGDISGITGLDSAGCIEGVTFATVQQDPLYFDPAARRLYQQLKARIALPLLRFTSLSADRRRYILAAAADTVPESSFIYDSETDTLSAPECVLPELDLAALRPMNTLAIESFDSTVLTSFLTLPEGEGPWPLILFPHAGPWAHDSWGFNAVVQSFCAAGYAVLQVNFRGSTGYGRSFIRKSIEHWGDDVQRDITAALHYVLTHYPVDGRRVFGFGTSFGGLAALLQTVQGQIQFAGVATLNAPTDLLAILQELPAAWVPLQSAFYHLIADPGESTAADRLRDASPLFQCEKIAVPILLMHSENDRIVALDQSQTLQRSLQTLNRECQLKMIAGEGHDILARKNLGSVVDAALVFFEER